MREAPDDGRKVMQILKEHYLSKGKPKVISLYTELTSVHKATAETITDCIIRAENTATLLKTSEETIGDGLLITMVLKGLLSNFNPFTTVIRKTSY